MNVSLRLAYTPARFFIVAACLGFLDTIASAPPTGEPDVLAS
jgi:hypothetical protein